MKLGISSAAAPGADFAALVEGCARRGLAALELVSGQAHGIGPGLTAGEARVHRWFAAGRGVTVAAYRAADGGEAASPEAARLSAALQAPVIAPEGALSGAALDRAARLYAGAGGTLLLAHGSDPAAAAGLRAAVEGRPELGLAWEFRPAEDGVVDPAAVLRAAGRALRHVRLHGGGPESSAQGGMGIGALMARLALARYAGAVALSPSRAAHLPVWRLWLSRGRGWGCGSKTGGAAPVALG